MAVLPRMGILDSIGRMLARVPLLDPDVDLSRFEGRRVEVTQVIDGTRYAWRGTLTGLVEEYVSGVHAGEERMLLRYRNATLRLI